jgi:hypothetical protein
LGRPLIGKLTKFKKNRNQSAANLKKSNDIINISDFTAHHMTIHNEMVQEPCAHVVLHDRIYVDFTDLLTVTEFT